MIKRFVIPAGQWAGQLDVGFGEGQVLLAGLPRPCTLQGVPLDRPLSTLTHKAVAATTETTDLGEFSALAAAYSLDRQNEQILRGAFKATITAWADTGRRVPLHWDHRGEAANIIGSVNPSSMRETDEGLYVEGELELEDSVVAREVWRSVKNNTVGLSSATWSRKTTFAVMACASSSPSTCSRSR